MARVEELIVIAILTVSHSVAQNSPCVFPQFMREAPGWDTGVRNEGRTSGSFIIFEDNKMVTIGYGTSNKESVCVRNLENDKVLVSTQEDDLTEYKCIRFIARSTHIVQMLESELSSVMDVTQCDNNSLAINDWLLIWTDTPTEYQTCGISGGFSITDIYIPSRNQHFCEDLSLPPRIEVECQHGEGILINFRYPQCVTDVNMPIYEMKFTCLGSWTAYGFTYTVITDGATFLPGFWLIRFPVNVNSDFYMEFFKDIVADRAETVTQTEDYLRWKLVRNLFPSLCEDESSDCSDCTEDDGFFCQKTCQKCDPVQVQERCQFDASLRGEWLESSWTGSRTIRITSSLLYPSVLSPFECFVLGGQDSLDWLEITGRHTVVSLHKNGCRPRYSCVAINSINQAVIQYRLSQSIVWPHSENLEPEDICHFNRFQDDSPPLASTYRSQYEKFLIKDPSGNNREKSTCNLNGNFVFSVEFQDDPTSTCVGTLKQCTDQKTLVLHFPSCKQESQHLNLKCLSSTVEVRERFILAEDSGDPRKIYCLVSSTETNKDKMYLLHGADCHVNTMATIQHKHFTHQIANLVSVEQYNSTTDCSISDIKKWEQNYTTTKNTFEETTTTATISVDETTSKKLDQTTMPLFTKAFEVSSTEKQFDDSSNTALSPEFTTFSTMKPFETSTVNTDTNPPETKRLSSKASSQSSVLPCFVVLICLFVRF